MKKIASIATILFMSFAHLSASPIELKDIANGAFNAEVMQGITPIQGTDQYAQIRNKGKQIVQYSFKTGQETSVLFDTEKTFGEKISTLDSYILSPDGKKILICTNTRPVYRRSYKGDFYIYTIQSGKLEKLSDEGNEQIPTWSPDGTQVAFVRNNNIFLVKLLYDNALTQVTSDGKTNELINGIPDWVNEEEFGFNKALAFNADGSMLCWIKYDESRVKTYDLQLFAGMKPHKEQYAEYPGTFTYKYPKAGQTNSAVSVWSYDIKSRKTRKMNLPMPDDGYIPRLKSSDDPNRMIVITMNRHQNELNIYGVNPRSTVSQLIVKDTDPKYIKEEVLENIQVGSESILLPSDRDGYMHLYLYNMNGSLIRQIGIDKYDITQVYGYDEKTGNVYYQAASINAHDRQILVTYKNGKTERLSSKYGWNSATFSGDFQYFINAWSDRDTPYEYTVCNNKGKIIATRIDNAKLKERLKAHNWLKKEFFSFTTSSGVQLDGWMIKPDNFDQNKKYPVIMYQYSGPGSQEVTDSWTIGSLRNGGAFDIYLAQQGFIVVCVDGRGTGARGADFEKCIYMELGKKESEDQVETARYIGTLPFVDKDNIGIWGWSFGGFNTLMSMSQGNGVFKAGVAVAAPTDWKYYDTIYTERYMRTPNENPDGYNDNPITRAERMNGNLLLCHGMADDNVHPQNAFEYTEALVQADKDFKELLYTNRNHSIYGGNTRLHLMRQIANWFADHLKK